MGTIISILIVIVCILLILVVLVQNSKGGGLASSFASSNQVMGVRKTADFLEKATWTLAASLLVLSIISTSFTNPSDGIVTGTGVESTTRKMSTDDPSPAAPANNAPAPTAPAPANPA
ncbi:MAG: preprotein translocase subunit SecG, partial [Bacteroidetes bacterium]|nr:preprotein translocase subunit SecG [Bacteroidota bacterium]